MFKRLILASLSATALLTTGAVSAQATPPQEQTLLNASYDVARELFAAINPKFQEHWKERTGGDVTIDQSHAGTSRQAQAIMQGLKADTVTFNQVPDIDVLAERGLVAENWKEAFPNNSSPYYSTIAFLVRKDNPKNIVSWDDLVRDDVRVVFPNPKTSGNARYTYLSAWLYAHQKFDGDEEKIRDFVAKLLHNVETFPTGGRGATVAFAQNGQGDALMTFESEVVNIANSDEFKDAELQVVVPPISVLAEFPVAVVDKVVDQNGTREVATEFLNYQYSDEIQELLTTFNYRVHNEAAQQAAADRFPPVELINPEDVLGSWSDIQETHFSSNGVLDQLLSSNR